MTGISPLCRISKSSSRGVIVTTGMGTCVSNVASSVILYTSSNVIRFTTQLKFNIQKLCQFGRIQIQDLVAKYLVLCGNYATKYAGGFFAPRIQRNLI